MQVIISEQFLKSATQLPSATQSKLASLLDLFKLNHFHPLLHTKKLIGKFANHYSFRITRDWRAIFIFEGKGIIRLIKVGNRKEIYK